MLVVLRHLRRTLRQLRKRVSCRLSRRRLQHSAANRDRSFSGVKKARSGFGLQERGTGDKLAIQPDARISPAARRGTMQNMQLIRTVQFRLRFIESDGATQRISGINNAAVLVFHSHVERGVVGKPISQQRVSASVARADGAVRHTDCSLPDRPRLSYLENLRLRIKKFA